MMHEIPDDTVHRTAALMRLLIERDCHIDDSTFKDTIIPLHDTWQRESMKAHSERVAFEAHAPHDALPEFAGPDFEPSSFETRAG